MGIKHRQSSTDSPKAEVGEIDTKAPFQSVKAAVSLFGEGAFSADKANMKRTKSLLTERVFAKETQLHLAEKELNKFKEQLKNAETTKAQALVELERAKRTVDDLTHKLRTLNESKESAVRATETAKNQAKQLEDTVTGNSTENGGGWKFDLDNAREQYASAISELDAAKQELWKIRQDFEASLDAKVAAYQQAEVADHAAEVNKERAAEISKEIASIQESLVHMKLAAEQTQVEQAKVLAGNDAQRQSARLMLEETEKKLESLKKEFNPEMTGNLEKKLAETVTEIGILQKEMENAQASELNTVRVVTTELDDAKETLHKVAEEESFLRNLVASLKQELESVKKEHSELKEKEMEAESVAGNLHVKLRKIKAELEEAFAGKSKTRTASEELISTVQQLSTESDNARKEVETMKRNAEELRKEAETGRIALEEAEKRLRGALKDAEEAKAAEAIALDKLKILSEKTNSSRALTSESGTQISISMEEYNSLNQKLEESNTLAELKVAAVVAQVEAVKASENEVVGRLEAIRKEIEEMHASTEEASNRAEMAEAAKKAVEGELRRWHEREQKKATETASRILADVESSDVSPPKAAFLKPDPLENMKTDQEGEKAPEMKRTLLPSLNGIFNKKKNQVEGASQSYLPGEKPV